MPLVLEPPTTDEEALHEIVNGVRVEVPSMGAKSSRIATQLTGKFEVFLETRALGQAVAECMFILDAAKDLRRRPDLAFVSAERWPLDRAPPDGDWPLAPDLAIEVASPNDLLENALKKIGEYFRYGVREVWLVLPAQRRVDVFRSEDDRRVVRVGGALETPLLPGFALPLAELFPWPQEAERNGQ